MVIMDERVRRREARRQRILNNLESRLQRLSGGQDNEIRELELSRETEGLETQNNFEVERDIVELVAQLEESGLLNNNEQQPQPRKQYRMIVIMALATFVNVQFPILERLFNIDMRSSHLNKIFLPMLIYEAFEYKSLTREAMDKSFLLYLLVMINAENSRIMPFIKYVEIITSVLQDVMVYFFIYVCCDVTKNCLLWIFS